MHTYNSRTEKIADRTDIRDLPRDLLYFGTDTTGADHHYSRIADTVLVLDASDDIEMRQNLDGRPLDLWIKFVESERGWSDLNYVNSFTALLTDALGGD